jgi:transporter family-2 protein
LAGVQNLEVLDSGFLLKGMTSMLEIVLTIFVGLLGGVAVGIQGPIAGAMSQRVGGTASSFVVHVSGAILSGLLLALRGGEMIHNWRALPWYMLGSGLFGLVLYLTLSHTLPRLGATTAVTLIIVGQLMMGMLIDQFGWFGVALRPVDGWRIAAAVLLLAGGYLMVR